jgi:uncharacterized protein YoxC
MDKEQEIKEKIKNLTKQMEYNNTANERMQKQINLLKEDVMILEKPKILESDLEIIVQDINEIVSTILESMSYNINDYNPEFEIGHENEVLISDINLDYDATEDIKTYLQTRFHTVVPDQTQNTN